MNLNFANHETQQGFFYLYFFAYLSCLKICQKHLYQSKFYMGYYVDHQHILTLIWVGFSGARFEVSRGWWGRVKLPPTPPPCLKLVKIVIETWNWFVNTHTYTVSENIPFCTKALLILLMSAFLLQKQHLYSKL